MSDPIRPDHYKPGPFEAIKVMKAWMPRAAYQGFLLGNALKYLSRLGQKDAPLQDAKKARQYLDWLIDDLAEDAAAPAPDPVPAPKPVPAPATPDLAQLVSGWLPCPHCQELLFVRLQEGSRARCGNCQGWTELRGGVLEALVIRAGETCE